MQKQVFVSYFVEAVLVTFFLLAYTWWKIQQHRMSHGKSEPKAYRFLFRTLEAFRRSLKDFLKASQLFSVTMLFAAVYISGTGTTQRKETQRGSGPADIPHGSVLYDMMLSMLASTFSMFPVMILYTIQRRDVQDSLKTKNLEVWFGRIIMTLIWILGIIEAFLSVYGNPDYDDHMSKDYNEFAELNCDWRVSFKYWYGMTAAQVLLIICPLLWPVVTVFLFTGFGKPGIIDKPWVKRWRSYWRLVIAWITLLVMWSLLGFFSWVRHKIDGMIGDLNESNK